METIIVPLVFPEISFIRTFRTALRLSFWSTANGGRGITIVKLLLIMKYCLLYGFGVINGLVVMRFIEYRKVVGLNLPTCILLLYEL